MNDCVCEEFYIYKDEYLYVLKYKDKSNPYVFIKKKDAIKIIEYLRKQFKLKGEII